MFTTLPQHPSIAAQPVAGRRIQDLAYHQGEIYMAYGDWNGNSGPIDIATWNPRTQANEVKLADVPTEAITVWREIKGSLYAPWIDPRVCWTCPGTYSTNAGGQWHNEFGPAGQHWLDITYNNGLIVSGSISNPDGSEGGAAAYQQQYDGTWRQIAQEAKDPPSGYERYYWLATVGATTYLQARESVDKSVQSYTGGAGATPTRDKTQYPWWNANRVDVVNGIVVGPTYSFDAKGMIRTGFNHVDLFKSGEVLYALRSDGAVKATVGNVTKGRRRNLVWTDVTTAPPNATSLALAEGQWYFGTRDGFLMRREN